MARPTPSLTRQRALNLIRKNRPTSLKQFSELGLLGRFIGAGVFREVYKVKDSGLIAKFPLNEAGKGKTPNYTSGVEHSASEVRKIRKLSKFKELRPHMPEIVYYDRVNGIVVMKYYPRLDLMYDARIELLGNVLGKVVRKLTHASMRDIRGDNVRMTGPKNRRRMIFADLGY